VSGILLVSPRPRPSRLTASVENAVPPPPRDLPRINPVIPGTLVLVTLGVVYFGGLIQVREQAAPIRGAVPATAAGPAGPALPVVKRAPIVLPPAESGREKPGVLGAMRRLAFAVATEPTTQATFTDRVALLRNYFTLLTPVDRTAIFGVIEFSAVEQALAQYEPAVAWAMLDRLLMRLQATFH
jgi:hypothetical protein